MTNIVLIDKLRKINKPLLVFEDVELDPIEILIFCFNKKDKVAIKKKIDEDISAHARINHKIIRVLSFDEIGIGKKWSNSLIKKSYQVAENVYQLCSLEDAWIFFAYILCCCKKKFWLYNNAIEVVKGRFKLNDEKDIFREFEFYINKNEYVFFWSRIKYYNFYNNISSINNAWLYHLILKYKIWMNIKIEQVVSKMARLRIITHEKITRNSFVKQIRREFNKTDIIILNKKGESSSGCVFFLIEDKKKPLFVKGNECSLYHSLKNEIEIQKVIQKAEIDDGNFLLMEDYCKKGSWIAFTYQRNETLKQLIQKRLLSKTELFELGKFLLGVLDRLDAIRVIHRDIRLENIMVIVDPYGNIEKYILFDFGFSVFESKDCWDTRRIWDKHVKKVVGGVYRYNDYIVDDAAAAYYTYLVCGGDKDDQYASEIKKRIGNRYLI